MRTQTRSGFTIIEVMLFLAITGALTVAILVGSGAAISRQRYRDSVNTFKGLIQEQYGQIANVVNSEVENGVCGESEGSLSIDTINEGGTGRPRGTSECLMIGRFLLIQSDKATAYNLIGKPPADDEGSSDSEILGAYSFATHSPEVYEMSWGAGVVEPKTKGGSTTSVLIVRSPRSGSILTYIQEGDHLSSIREMIDDENMKQKDFCVDPDPTSDRPSLRSRLAVRIKARAANQSAIEIPLESEKVCDD